MKKLFSVSLMLVILISGCRADTSKPDYIVLHRDPPNVRDGMTTLLYYDREVTLLRYGERYGESLYLAAYGDKDDGKFGTVLYEHFVFPEEYAPRLGEAVKLTADMRVDQGGIDGGITNYIAAEDVKELRALDMTDRELCSAVPLWDDAVCNAWFPTDGFSSGATCGGLYIFRYDEDGAVYMISPQIYGDDKSCTLFRDGQPVSRYGGILCAPFEENGGENHFFVLCDENFDVSFLDNPYTESPGDFYLLGTFYPRSIDIGDIYCDTARLKEGAELDEEKFVIYSEEDRERYSESFDDLRIFHDATVFGIKSQNRLEVKAVSVDTETNHPRMVLEETECQGGGYSIIEIPSEALRCADISDFSYTIE
ncbi:MAG: hypothetical protein K2O14_08110 [Oscillospiraceae bacterium]|nr:hypothetical protein [Oscillospiraceae bacterium]